MIKTWDSSYWSVSFRGITNMVKSLRISLKLNRSNNNLEGHKRLTPRNFFESYSVDAKFCILMHFWCYNPESKLCPEMMFFSLFQAKKKSEFIIIYFYILPIINCPIDCSFVSGLFWTRYMYQSFSCIQKQYILPCM